MSRLTAHSQPYPPPYHLGRRASRSAPQARRAAKVATALHLRDFRFTVQPIDCSGHFDQADFAIAFLIAPTIASSTPPPTPPPATLATIDPTSVLPDVAPPTPNMP